MPELQGLVRVISKISQKCEVNKGTYGTCGGLRAVKWSTRFYIGAIIDEFGAPQKAYCMTQITNTKILRQVCFRGQQFFFLSENLSDLFC
jgi:hypothetical protein